MTEAIQFEMQGLRAAGVKLPHEQEFELWNKTEGGNWVLEQVYIKSARYAARWKATGQRVSIRLIWERVRDEELYGIRKAHPEFKRHDGYAMNDHFHSYAVRHIISRRPDWAGMFETRELDQPRQPVETRTITIRKYG